MQYACLDEALEFFHKMPERNVVSWTTMIVGYAQNGRVREALEIFRRMPERNAVSWNAMLAGFTWNGDVDKALELFQVMPERDVASWNAIITGLAQNGRLDEALKLFDEMPEQNVVSWTSVIAGYAQNGHSEQAINFFQHLQMKGVKPVPDTFTSVLPACADLAALGSGQQIHEDIIRSGYQLDVFVGNALIDMYAKCGCIEDARQVFKRMSRHDVVSWNALIAGYAQIGHASKALTLVREMQLAGFMPDYVTVVSLLSACAYSGDLREGHWHSFIKCKWKM